MFHILYGWMAGFILSFKVFWGQKLDKLSEKSHLCKKIFVVHLGSCRFVHICYGKCSLINLP